MKWISRVFSLETSWNVSFWVDSSIITLIQFVVGEISLECGWLGRVSMISQHIKLKLFQSYILWLKPFFVLSERVFRYHGWLHRSV